VQRAVIGCVGHCGAKGDERGGGQIAQQQLVEHLGRGEQRPIRAGGNARFDVEKVHRAVGAVERQRQREPLRQDGDHRPVVESADDRGHTGHGDG
jgi:hypothetical protein